MPFFQLQKLGRLADEVRERHGALPAVSELSDPQLSSVIEAARSTLPPSPPPSLENLTAAIRTIHDAARAEPVTPQQSMLLLAAYASALAIAVSSGLLLTAH